MELHASEISYSHMQNSTLNLHKVLNKIKSIVPKMQTKIKMETRSYEGCHTGGTCKEIEEEEELGKTVTD
jgi:RNA binding exosome subunit